MSREIKFRAWDKFRLKMYSVSSLVQDANLFSVGGVGPHIISKDGNLVLLSEIELMQYTGLKDKNGIEIYEGDIYKNCEGLIMTVIWKNNSSGFVFEYKFKRIYQGEIYIDTNYIRLGDTSSKRWGGEVIGNIYENPNLLKEEE
ncbi:hypothetical protein FC839_18145 [Clostridium botulinum]|uniref:YopX protein domain-containing protein n=2 Tax=Clostridium botulinum TaxID=1491 RepID=A0A6B4JSS6_CLOBO|nr:YopX family protein [Clostridium botulinum]EES48643.1 conserved hypothetical protein [Clostridium botulinum E1 str. 'BoNT E Beluga']MBY6762852.1 hypothetical protein [Clostridium botulinum]MBY6921636.1 hypothetical protein [Clostridium botulinum]NFH70784.1 hypothetical protein [Clostridium botulinum]NFJ59635.1 hypothetical protein [Clostridium botulinum]